MHVPGQLIPAGVLVTVPVPVPARETLSVRRVEAKVGITVRLELSVTVHTSPATESQPLQPVKVEFTLAAGVKVRTVPLP